MISHFDIFYEVVNPATQETDFVTEDRYIAEHHYEKGYIVYETHRTLTRQTAFTHTRIYSVLYWNDEDSENINPVIEET